MGVNHLLDQLGKIRKPITLVAEPQRYSWGIQDLWVGCDLAGKETQVKEFNVDF